MLCPHTLLFPCRNSSWLVERPIKQHRLWVTINFTEPNTNDILLGKVPGPLKRVISSTSVDLLWNYAYLFNLLTIWSVSFQSTIYLENTAATDSFLIISCFETKDLTTNLAAVFDALIQSKPNILWTEPSFTALKEKFDNFGKYACWELDEEINPALIFVC